MIAARILAVVRLSCPRWNAFFLGPFLVTFLAGGGETETAEFALCAVGCLLFSAVTDLTNRFADRREDAVDYPVRKALLQLAGERFVAGLAIAAAVAYVFVLIALVAFVRPPLLALVLWVAALLGAISYSIGPRVKTKKYVAPLHYGAVSAAGAVLGWLHHRPLIDIVPTAAYLWILGGAMLGWKDIDNLTGDLSVGYRSIYVDISEARRSKALAQVMVAAPFMAVLVCVGLQLRPPRDLWILVCWPLGILFGYSVITASDDVARKAVREFGAFYWLLFMSAALLAFAPAPITVFSIFGLLAWWLVMSRVLNCDAPGFQRRHAFALTQMFIPGPKAGSSQAGT